MKNKQTVREEIKNLIDRYKRLEEDKGIRGLKDISESDVRSDFIDELFSILGWDTKNPDEYNREKYIRGVGYADITLQVDGQPVIFVEAKRFGSIPEVDRQTTDWIEEERQVMNYAASPERRIKWAILTNFEKLRVFNALNGLLVLEIKGPYQYEKRLEELLYLSREAVAEGRLDKLATREERPDIDEQFLESLEKWRLSLANDIYEQNRENAVLLDGDEISLDKLKSAVQRILDRLIVVRYAEDKLILDNPDQLKSILESWRLTSTYTSLYEMVKNFFVGFDEIHNSKLFEQGHISEMVKIGSEVMAEIIKELYQINFRKFDFDVLGNTYETYLGHELYFADTGKLDLRASRGTRKKSGIYYTPPYVVDYIVKNTVGEMLKDKTPDEVSQLRVLDPACGSGSFLIKAFDYFAQYYAEENEKRREDVKKKIEKYQRDSGNSIHAFDNSGLELVRDFEKKILKENIYGVDLDGQAAEIASVNLVLKALTKGERLPLILGENIKVGNSLISGSEEELRKYFGDDWRKKKPFNWEDSFPGIFENSLIKNDIGFDVVIGNPPYIEVRTIEPTIRDYFYQIYDIATKKTDVFALFIKRGIELLKEGGLLGFITSMTWFMQESFFPLRTYILENCSVKQIIVTPKNTFKDATVDTAIIILQKFTGDKKEETRYKNMIECYKIETIKEGVSKPTIFNKIPQKVFLQDQQHLFNLEYSPEQDRISDKIASNSKKLGNIANVDFGCVTGDNKRFVHDVKTSSNDYKVLHGKNIRRYIYTWGGDYLTYEPERMIKNNPVARPGERERFECPEKIILQRHSGTNMVGAYDTNKYYCLVSTVIVRPDNPDYSIKYILGILNSKLIRYWSNNELNTASRSIRVFKNVPIKVSDKNEQEAVIRLVDKIINLYYEVDEINTDFKHYVSLYSRKKDINLSQFLEKIGVEVEDKEVLNYANQKEGRIVGFEVTEEGEWLAFTVEYERKTRGGNVDRAKMKAFRCKITDERLRKFLYYSIREFITPSKVGAGNLYERILKINVPRFHDNWEKNVETINEIMDAYLPRIQKWQQLQEDIRATDQQIDQMVYDLYGLTDEEIRIVEESLGER
ncbi:MAG: N-6 DNA methylase [Candidatus Thermoplasmatota archaeon]|nr:N-6 DNA methylase [Candidatus Thermoplasmatota archaeon]